MKETDLISRQALCEYALNQKDKSVTPNDIMRFPSAQPEYYDYSDIEPLWKYFAEENDINLTSTAKQLKDAMWCGYRKGKADAQSDLQPTCNQLATDTISRAAAIDAMCELMHHWFGGDPKDEIREIKRELENLPSAYPETDGFCTDCKEYDQERHYCPRFDRVIKKTVEEMKAEQRWIPIKWHDCTKEDREKYGFSDFIVAVFDCEMPDDEQEILVTTSHGYVEKDVCYIDDGYSLDSGWDWIDDIKAWMPLPEPYKEDE